RKRHITLPSEMVVWQPEFTDKTLSRKTGAVQPYSCSYSVLLFISVLDKPGIHWALFQARERNGSAFRGFLYDVLTTIQPAVACRFSGNGLALRKFCLFCLEGFNDIATTNNKGAGRKTAD
ncbi:hypothetical protein, partial [Escherichia coli]